MSNQGVDRLLRYCWIMMLLGLIAVSAGLDDLPALIIAAAGSALISWRWRN